jgi:predicted anti-sigma-YlaC factor YlaD
MRATRLRFALDHRFTRRRLSDELDAELEARAGARVRRHTEQCPECRALLASLRRLLAVLEDAAAADAREPVPEIAAAVSARLRETA